MPSANLRKFLPTALEWQLPAVLGAIASAMLMTWPLAANATDHILAAPFFWDAYTNTMIMGGHVDAAFGRGPLSLYDNYFFAPLPHTIAFNENLFGLSLIFAPFYLISGNALFAYNATLLCSVVVSVLFTHLLVRRLTGDAWAGFIAGIAFAYCPYVFFEAGRLQLIATQWIPACFLFLHRAVERRSRGDVIALWVCYLLQVGSCLYYAMFLIPLLGLVGGALLYRHRPPRAFYLWLIGAGVAASMVALAMVYPYFLSRKTFDLERSLDFAASYDGKLSFLTNVHETNRTLTALHHRGQYRGAHEEIAFPGFVVLGLALLAAGLTLVHAVRTSSNRVRALARWSAAVAVAIIATLLTHSMLAAVAVLGFGAWRERAAVGQSSQLRGLYLATWILAVTMFVGLTPFEFRGSPVHGLYYYFHTYFPGFNGIRKVSRQAVMTTFVMVVFAGYGSSWLFSRLAAPWQRHASFAVLLLATCFELRSFPHPLKSVWAGDSVPAVYGFIADLPEEDLVVSLPQNNGTNQFRGDHGLAFHNYLMLLHAHRSPNGQSSWEPTVTTLTNRALSQLPDDGARRILYAIGARHLLIHGGELDPPGRSLLAQLTRDTQHYRHVYEANDDHVFSLVADPDPTLALLDTPPLPEGAARVPNRLIRASAVLEQANLTRAIDDDPVTAWSTRRVQARGQTFELSLTEPRAIVAFELENHWNQTHVPMAYELAVATDSGWRTVAEQPQVRVPRELVFSPKTFVTRIVFPSAVETTRVRLTIAQPVPGTALTIHEARLYELAAPKQRR